MPVFAINFDERDGLQEFAGQGKEETTGGAGGRGVVPLTPLPKHQPAYRAKNDTPERLSRHRLGLAGIPCAQLCSILDMEPNPIKLS